jgi:hypothetical protein
MSPGSETPGGALPEHAQVHSNRVARTARIVKR